MWPALSPSHSTLVAPFQPTGKFIFFDVGSVIIDLDWDSFHLSLQSYFEKPEHFDFEKFARKAKDVDIARKWSTGAIGPAEYTRLFLHCLGASESPNQTQKVKSTSSLVVGPVRMRVLRLIKKLRQLHFGLGVLSNATPWHETDIEATISLKNHFDLVVFSQDYGCEKPEPSIYEKSFSDARDLMLKTRNIKLEPQDVLFLDDTPANVIAAQNEGWNARLVALLKEDDHQLFLKNKLEANILAEKSKNSKNLIFGDEAAKRVESLFQNFF